MSTPNKGALISPELSARIHWTLGRVSGEEADAAFQYGSELIEAIQQELSTVFTRGVDAVRRTQLVDVNGGGSSASDYRDGAGVLRLTIGRSSCSTTEELLVSDLQRISAIRTAATWMRRTSKPIEQYPKCDKLDERMRTEATQFAAGILPWPSRWTQYLYEIATSG